MSKPSPDSSFSLPTRRELLHRIALLEAKVADLEASRPDRLGPKPIQKARPICSSTLGAHCPPCPYIEHGYAGPCLCGSSI